jgi:hypothetical protein
VRASGHRPPRVHSTAADARWAGGLTVTSGRGRHAAATSCVCCVHSVPDGEVYVVDGESRHPGVFFPRVQNIEPARCSQHTFFFFSCAHSPAVPAVSLSSGPATPSEHVLVRRLCTSTCHAFVLYSRTAWD